MPKLSDTQLVLLSNAAQRDDRAIETPTLPGESAVRRAVGQLIKRGLLEETAARPGMPVWRNDEAAGPIALLITEAGLNAIGIGPEELGEAAQDAAARAPAHGPADDQGRVDPQEEQSRSGWNGLGDGIHEWHVQHAGFVQTPSLRPCEPVSGEQHAQDGGNSI